MFLKGLSLLAVAGGAQFAIAFRVVTAEEAWSAINPGWNLGNTLDAIPDETSWGNAAVVESTFDEIKRAGFKSVRIPVTWTDHFASQAPDYIVNATWMDRVETVVDWSLSKGFWVVLNVHHDSWQWADFTIEPETLEERKTKFEKLWLQIADRFKSKSEKLILEPLNEPAGSSSQENAEQYNDANQRFVNIVRSSGGYNADRLLTLPGLNTNIQRTVDWFVEPANASNYILHVHDYDPWDFVSTSWGRTFWGTAADKQAIEDTFIALQTKFQAPAMIGEWGLTGTSVENGAAWNYFDFFVRTSKKYELGAQLWDNGNDHYDRVNKKWRDPVKLAIIQNAVKDIPNTLPAYGQLATIWVKKGQSAGAAAQVNLEYNENVLRSVVSNQGSTLKKGTDYITTATGFNLTSAYFDKVTSNPAVGVRDTLTVKSSAGIQLPLEVTVYDTPTVAQNVYELTSTADLSIPVVWNGAKLATVKAVRKDGVYLKDDWTQWNGPLQQARINWGDFGTNGNNLVLYSSILNIVKSSGQAVDFTFEFWPRTDQTNNVTVTVSVV
ncbi:uncharacterized protein H6S33_012599 [Morchella sextelata]|uniref:uncharacterized protein n=1 Tax=Morchella sextelata TaxID=1174677 RepID=UPI001D05B5F4|nr:uncharacterized protein H6S33_012599 [Morchella sextelata]KAH0610053.1 hypothetical protein H6S33_012599 [Morchella sextelata]